MVSAACGRPGCSGAQLPALLLRAAASCCDVDRAEGGWQFDKALFEFELQLADYKADVGEELYAETLQGIRLQSVIQVLRADGKNSFEDFQQRSVLPCVSTLVSRVYT